MFFNKEGFFNLDEQVAQSSTFQKIMADEIVTDDELKQQADHVIALYRKLQANFTEEQLQQIAEVIVQTGVLYSLSQYKELQELKR